MASLSDEKLWEYIHKCNVQLLKTLLAKVGISHSTNKPVLQLRLFHAVRLGLDIIPTVEEKDKQVAASHLAKLDIGNGFMLPHPLTLNDWEESSARTNYPDVTTKDIEQYFYKCNRDVGISTGGNKALSEGFSLFTSNHVQSVAYHKVVEILGICFVRGYVIPTMRLTADKYMVWVQLYKETGAVRIGDCHCIAGVSSMCKHIAALLYYITNEVSKGKNLACTSVKQIWHQPAPKKLRTSAMVSDIKTPKATSRVCPGEKPQRSNFDPRPIAHHKEKTLDDFKLDELSEMSNGKAAILLYTKQFRKDISDENEEPNISFVENEVEIETTIDVPPIISTFSKSTEVTSESFIECVRFNELGRNEIERSTRNQSESELWVDQRKGRMTASVMHSVLLHVEDDNVCGELATVVETIMGYNDEFSSASTKHGNKGEPVVRKRYASCQKKIHKGLRVNSSGLWVLEEFPLLAATPDGIVNCDCCPARLLEIKCPFKYRNLTIHEYAEKGTSKTKARHETVIIVKDNEVVVNTDHQYYTQVQTQMLCTGLTSCDLVIGTEALTNNFSVFTIHRNYDFCCMLINKAKVFYHKVIFPELQNRSYYKNKQIKKKRKLVTLPVKNN